MRLPALLIFLGASALGTAGCMKHSYSTGAGGNVHTDARYSAWHHHFLFGLIGDKEVDTKSVCPSGNATIKDEVSFVNGLVAAFVGAIYSPTTVEIYCDGNGKSASLTIDAETMRSIAKDPATMSVVREILPAKAAELAAAIEQARTRTYAQSSSSARAF